MSKAQSVEIKRMLLASFLNFLSEEDVGTIVQNTVVEELMMLERVSRDETPHALYFILEGEIIQKQKGSLHEISRLYFGQSLELKVLLLRVPQWQYEWFSEGKAKVAKIEWTVIEKVILKYPHQLQYLARMTQSVSLQRLKRDLFALNVSRSSIVDFISSMRQEKFSDLVIKHPNEKMIVTVSFGEVFVQINDDERPHLLTTFQAGDTAIIDPEQKSIKYWGSEDSRVWVITEKEWQNLLQKEDFSQFLKFFSFRTGEMLNEDSQAEISKTTPLNLIFDKISVPKAKLVNFSGKRGKPIGKSSWIRRLRKYYFRPVIPTSFDENRTGTVAIIYFLQNLGIKVHQRDIDAMTPDEWSDVSLESLQVKAHKVGLSFEFTDIHEILRRPADGTVLVHLNDGFALIYDSGPDNITLGDFNFGKYRNVYMSDFLADLRSQQCLRFAGAKNVFKKRKRKFTFRDGVRFLSTSRPAVFLFFLGGLLGFFCELTIPVLSQNLLDQVVSQGRIQLLNPLILIILFVTVLGVLLDWFNQIQNNYLNSLISTRLKRFFHQKIFNSESLVLQRMGVSQIMTRLSDIDQISSFMVSQYLQSFLSVFFMLCSLSVLWMYNYKLIFIALIVLPIGMLFTHLLKSKLENLKVEQSRNKARENRLIIEHFSSQDDMRTLKGILSARWKWDFNNLLFSQNLMKGQKLSGLFQVFQLISSEGVKIACFFYSIKIYIEGGMTLGQVMAVVMIVPRFTMPLQGIINSFYQYHSVRVIIERLNDLLPTNLQTKSNKVIVEFKKKIEVQKVQFRYEKESVQEVLRGIECQIQVGENIAVVGPAGAGKSTLAYLLSGLHQPESGSIQFDEVAIQNIDPACYARGVSLVEQEGRLFGGTILENIALGDLQPDLEHGVRCAKIAGVDEDILGRPGGFASTLLHGGVGLSEGQRQRLLIARGLYKNPQILILDEATSFLDPISEAIVIKNVIEAMRGKTIIFLTQRIQITTRVDRVFFMEAGCITEAGSHKELIDAKKRYFDFYLKHLSIC